MGRCSANPPLPQLKDEGECDSAYPPGIMTAGYPARADQSCGTTLLVAVPKTCLSLLTRKTSHEQERKKKGWKRGEAHAEAQTLSPPFTCF